MPVPVASPPLPRRQRRPVLLAIIAAVAAVLLSGCARAHISLAVQADDTVSGELIIGTVSTGDADHGPKLDIPAELTSRVDVTPYAADGYVGSRVLFKNLSFDETDRLTSISDKADDRMKLSLRRVGSRVAVTGQVDLTTVAVDKADFQLQISFPGRVTSTNGENDGGTVTWKFTPGQVDDVQAAVAYDDPQAPSPLNWTLLLAGVVILAGGAVVLLARRDRNPALPPR